MDKTFTEMKNVSEPEVQNDCSLGQKSLPSNTACVLHEFRTSPTTLPCILALLIIVIAPQVALLSGSTCLLRLSSYWLSWMEKRENSEVAQWQDGKYSAEKEVCS